MLRREDLTVNQEVRFGRPQGMKTLCKICGLGPVNATVEILEQRGEGKYGVVGGKARVPYGMLYAKDGDTTPAGNWPPAPETMNIEDIAILDAILACYAAMSPGELTKVASTPKTLTDRVHILNRKLKALQSAFGREVTNAEAQAWANQPEEEEAELELTTADPS